MIEGDKRLLPGEGSHAAELSLCRTISAALDLTLEASLRVVDNNRKVVGALSVVGEKFSKILAKFCKIYYFPIFLKKNC